MLVSSVENNRVTCILYVLVTHESLITWQMSVYGLTTLRELLYLCNAPGVHLLNQIDLVSAKVVTCLQCADASSQCAVLALDNCAVEAILSELVSHRGDDAIAQLKTIRLCVR